MSEARFNSALVIFGSLLSMSGCAPESTASDAGLDGMDDTCSEAPSRFASSVTSFEFGSGQDFGQDKFPDSVLGPPSGGGCCAGSLDVTSLGDGGFATLEFQNNSIVDEPGADFIVFENAFHPPDAPGETVFAELGQVSVSQDGISWFTYPCTATGYPFGSCAGWRPVLLNAKSEAVDALDPELVGGDPFDLADAGLGWARYVKVADRTMVDGGPGTFDLDAVGIVHPSCPPPKGP